LHARQYTVMAACPRMPLPAALVLVCSLVFASCQSAVLPAAPAVVPATAAGAVAPTEALAQRAAAAAAIPPTAAQTPPPVVEVPGLGSLSGKSSREGVAKFLGVPYAKPPTGDRRWRSPQPYGPWRDTGPRSASRFRKMCWGATGFLAVKSKTYAAMHSEDCLFLNIYAPVAALNSTSSLPVMVWIHGGKYQIGTPNTYRGGQIVRAAKSSVIVVTIAYRLNVFGFLGSSNLASRSETGSMGDFGIQDQQLALMWVRDHIAAFGGNGGDVTIFGESSGGNSVINHIVRSKSYGLYSKAIIQSGAYHACTSLKLAEKFYSKFLGKVQCSDLQCLLGMDARTVWLRSLLLPNKAMSGPVVDGVSLTASPIDMIKAGNFNKHVPVMTGSNHHEEAYFFIANPKRMPYNLSQAQFENRLSMMYSSALRQKLLEVYSPSAYHYPTILGKFSQQWWELMAMSTDRTYGQCAHRRLIRNLLRGGTPAAYFYFFDHPTQSNIGLYGTGPGSVTVPHMSEIPYVFNNKKLFRLRPEEAALADQMSAYWVQFAKTGNPNLAGLPDWPAYNEVNDTNLVFDVAPAGIHTASQLQKTQCDFWRDVAKNSTGDTGRWDRFVEEAPPDPSMDAEGSGRPQAADQMTHEAVPVTTSVGVASSGFSVQPAIAILGVIAALLCIAVAVAHGLYGLPRLLGRDTTIKSSKHREYSKMSRELGIEGTDSEASSASSETPEMPPGFPPPQPPLQPPPQPPILTVQSAAVSANRQPMMAAPMMAQPQSGANLFDRIDQNHDGVIDRRELLAFQEAQAQLSPSQVSTMTTRQWSPQSPPLVQASLAPSAVKTAPPAPLQTGLGSQSVASPASRARGPALSAVLESPRRFETR